MLECLSFLSFEQNLLQINKFYIANSSWHHAMTLRRLVAIKITIKRLQNEQQLTPQSSKSRQSISERSNKSKTMANL